MTFDTQIKVGPISYTVREMMKQVVSANTRTEAHDKAYWIQKALMKDYDQEINDKLNEVLKEYHDEPAFAIIDPNESDGISPPPFLTNQIFVTELKSPAIYNGYVYIDIDKLWRWIYFCFVRSLKAKYEWLALFLFCEARNLFQNKVDAQRFCRQMNQWFGKSYTTDNASYSQVNCYQAGFFRSEAFKYKQWVNGNFSLPSNYSLRKDQKEDGFKRIHELCATLEANYSIDKIRVKDTNM